MGKLTRLVKALSLASRNYMQPADKMSSHGRYESKILILGRNIQSCRQVGHSCSHTQYLSQGDFSNSDCRLISTGFSTCWSQMRAESHISVMTKSERFTPVASKFTFVMWGALEQLHTICAERHHSRPQHRPALCLKRHPPKQHRGQWSGREGPPIH